MGNRGDLHAPDGTLGRQWRSRRWLSCVLEGNGWKAPMDEPGRYYPLFFHDEAVAIAAGHRPCGQCRPGALAKFISAWKAGHGLSSNDWLPLREIDAALHRARIGEMVIRRRSHISDLPDGAFVRLPGAHGRAALIMFGQLWPWQHGAYGSPEEISSLGEPSQLTVLTPSPVLAALRGGYEPIIEDRLQRVATARQ